MDIYSNSLKDYQNPYQNLYGMLSHSAFRFPEKPAIIDDQEEVPYREFKHRVDLLSQLLAGKYNLKEKDRIAIVMVNSSRILEAFYASMKLGIADVMVNTKFKAEQITALLADTDIKLILADSMWLDKLKPAAELLHVDIVTADHFLDDAEAYPETVPVDGREDAAVIMHTSGTTGMPKGIMVSQSNIMEASFGYQEIQGLSSADLTVLSVPIFHILGLSCVSTLFIYIGGTIVLSAFYDVDDVIAKIRKYRPTHFHSVPTIHLQLIDSENPQKDFSSIRVAIIGGAPISREDIDRVEAQMPNATIHLAYGMTETAGSGTLSLTHKGPLHAVPNVYMRCVDSAHQDVPVGEIGELVFCGPCIARNRWKLDPLPDDHEYSGDVGYMDADGNVYILDRIKDVVNRGGEKIFPIQVETVLLTYPGVERAAVYAVSNKEYGEVPYAAIIPCKGARLTEADILKYLKGKIATYETPVHVDFMEEFPVTHNGKIRKAELRKAAEERIKS